MQLRGEGGAGPEPRAGHSALFRRRQTGEGQMARLSALDLQGSMDAWVWLHLHPPPASTLRNVKPEDRAAIPRVPLLSCAPLRPLFRPILPLQRSPTRPLLTNYPDCTSTTPPSDSRPRRCTANQYAGSIHNGSEGCHFAVPKHHEY